MDWEHGEKDRTRQNEQRAAFNTNARTSRSFANMWYIFDLWLLSSLLLSLLVSRRSRTNGRIKKERERACELRREKQWSFTKHWIWITNIKLQSYLFDLIHHINAVRHFNDDVAITVGESEYESEPNSFTHTYGHRHRHIQTRTRTPITKHRLSYFAGTQAILWQKQYSSEIDWNKKHKRHICIELFASFSQFLVRFPSIESPR